MPPIECRRPIHGLTQVERVTNHDVKAIEYVMKRRLQGNAELAEVRPCVNA